LLRLCAAPLRLPSRPLRSDGRDGLRVLLIRPDHIGDLLFATPALRLLRTSLPDAQLTALVGPWGKPVLAGNPCLDEVIECEFPGFGRKPNASFLAPYSQLWQWAARIRREHFDLAVMLRFDHWWGAWLADLAGIPVRIGYDIPECRPFLTQALPYQDARHEVQQNLTLAKAAVRWAGQKPKAGPELLEFALSPTDQLYIASYLSARGIGLAERLIVTHPGAGAPVKLWTAEKWAEVADALAERLGARVVITGGRDELDLAWSVYALMRADAVVAAGDTSLGQLAALFSRSALVLGPDCGPLHLAVAVGAPTVHLYGPASMVKFGPWGEAGRHIALTSLRSCIPCNRLDYPTPELVDHRCVSEIAVAGVLAAAAAAMAGGAAATTARGRTAAKRAYP
jgi:heptosyltransferase-2/heptosyltransferase-3